MERSFIICLQRWSCPGWLGEDRESVVVGLHVCVGVCCVRSDEQADEQLKPRDSRPAQSQAANGCRAHFVWR